MELTFSPLGVDAVIVEFSKTMSEDTMKHILSWKKVLESNPFHGFREAVPAYTTLTIYYDPFLIGTPYPYETVLTNLQTYQHAGSSSFSQTMLKEIPVCYEVPFALDLQYVAQYHGLTEEEVIELHHAPIYQVYFLGFSPGFPFLGGMNSKISTPRRSSPRLQIPSGSVGIAGGQTGIYPLETPGGWQIIGRTPLQLFQPQFDPPTYLLPGDQIRFVPISREEFLQMEGEIAWQSK